MVYRHGPGEDYQRWDRFKHLPVISVTPMRRPKLDSSKQRYAFAEEKEMMRDKLKTILRIAAANGHHDLCLGSFGTGSVWKNPAKEVAEMWKDLLFNDDEFAASGFNQGQRVFALEGEWDGVVVFADDERGGYSEFLHAA